MRKRESPSTFVALGAGLPSVEPSHLANAPTSIAVDDVPEDNWFPGPPLDDGADGFALLPLDQKDVPVLFETMYAVHELAVFTSRGAAYPSLDSFTQKLAGWMNAGWYHWAITQPPSVTPLGHVFIFPTGSGVYELGIILAHGGQGKGLATRAVVTATRFAKEKLGAMRVFARVDPRNAASRALFARAGYEQETGATHLRNTSRSAIGICHTVVFASVTDAPEALVMPASLKSA